MAAIHRPRWRGYTAFVLSGGGARGALQVGALRALLEHGERPDVIIGTSIGAWNGAWLARNPTPERTLQLAEVWRGLHSLQVMLGIEAPPGPLPRALAKVRLFRVVRRLAAGYPSLYSDIGLRLLLNKYVGDLTFEKLAVPLRVIATDLTGGTRAIFHSGPLAPAVLASSAIPGFFPPVCIDDRVYVDGGAIDNCSIETALSLGARRIFVLDGDYDHCEEPAPIWNGELTSRALRERGASMHALVAVLERTTQVVYYHQFNQALARVPRGVELHLIRPGTGITGGVMDFERAPEWIERGYDATRVYLRTRVPQAVASAS